jgi:hypothetical protein
MWLVCFGLNQWFMTAMLATLPEWRLAYSDGQAVIHTRRGN